MNTANTNSDTKSDTNSDTNSDTKSDKKSDTKSDKKILENGVVNFFYKKAEYRSLSNFSEHAVVIADDNSGEIREYESGEHGFHGEKYVRLGQLSNNDARKRQLLEYGKQFAAPCVHKTGAEVKRLGGKRGLLLRAEELEAWNRVSVDVQRAICRYKWEHAEEVRTDLVKSAGKLLVHPAMRCSADNLSKNVWEGRGAVVDGEIVILGKNRLGQLWMELRDEVV